MKQALFVCLAAAVLLAACATADPEGLKPGASLEQVQAAMGQPRATYPLPDGGKRLEYAGGGARTYMVDIDASGRMVRVVQALNEANFRQITQGMTTEQVLMLLGQPSQRQPGGRQGGQIWYYNYVNQQCQWFEISIGSDGRTLGPGSFALLPPCMDAPS